ncbi:MAG: alpha/beta hydrolase [Candidatus Omnitrophica bacterium]|nr:alpha/beta hydrolase [Candidatus Omnitrophota bacterium]
MIYIVLCVIILLLYIRFLEYKVVFHPDKNLHAAPDKRALVYEDVSIRTPDNKQLHGWFIPQPNALQTLIFLHGNAGNISDRLDKIETFHHLGLNVFIFDYRGYGQSQGVPSEKGIYLDAVAAYDYLTSRADIDSGKIVAYGASLGGAVAVDLATKRSLTGIILDSTLSSGHDMARRLFPFVPVFMIKIRLDSLTKIQSVRIPKFFIHTQDDDVIPYALGQKLFQAAPGPKKFVTISGGHNDGWAISQSIWIDSMKAFFKQLLPENCNMK